MCQSIDLHRLLQEKPVLRSTLNNLQKLACWDQGAKELKEYADVRDIQKEFKKKGIKFNREANEETSGPEHFILEDPDGNRIMFDQYV